VPSTRAEASKAKALAEAGVSTSAAQRNQPSPPPQLRLTLCGGSLGSDGRPRDRPSPTPHATRSASQIPPREPRRWFIRTELGRHPLAHVIRPRARHRPSISAAANAAASYRLCARRSCRAALARDIRRLDSAHREAGRNSRRCEGCCCQGRAWASRDAGISTTAAALALTTLSRLMSEIVPRL
jgi:hypothetical protein